MNKKMKLLVTIGIIAPSVASMVSCSIEKHKGEIIKLVSYGEITDKGFNTQAYDALVEIYNQLDLGTPKITIDTLVSLSQDSSAIVRKYVAAYEAGAQIILAPGYHNVDAIKLFNDNHKEKLKFILADGEHVDNNVAGIVYDTKPAGFLAGVLSGAYLQAKNDKDPKVGTFGGGPYPGVTDFMTGWVQGIKWYTTNYKYDIKFYNNGVDDAWTNTSFEAGKGLSISQSMVIKGVDIILPVAGVQTADTLKAVKNTDTKVIGVDSDAKLIYPKDKQYILTSILKNVKDSLVQVWRKNYVENHGISNTNIKKGFGKTSYATLDSQLVGIEMTETTTMMKSIYAIVESSEVQTAAKSKWVQKTTWKKSLKYIQANLVL